MVRKFTTDHIHIKTGKNDIVGRFAVSNRSTMKYSPRYIMRR